MGNEVILKIGGEEDPSLNAALGEAAAKQKKLQEDAAAASRAAAEQEEADLKLIQAQYGQLGPAAAKAYGQAQASATAAAAAVDNFGKLAERGAKGAERAAGQAAVAIEKLEAEIKQLRATGADTEFLEGKLRELRAEMERNAVTAGKMKKAIRDAGDDIRATTAGAGELEGQIGSLEGIFNALGAKTLGSFASKLVAVQGAFLITVAAAKQIYEILDVLTKDAAARWEASLERQAEREEIASGAALHYAQNLRNVLAKQGYDVASASLSQLIAMEDEFQGRLRARGPAIEKLAEQFRGNRKSLIDDTAVVLGALDEVGGAELANTELAKKAAAAVSEVIERYKTAGKEVPVILQDWNAYLQMLVGTHASLLSILTKVLDAIGIKGPEAINKQIDAVREYSVEVERSGKVNADQAILMLAQIDQIRKAIQLLPEHHRAAFLAMLQDLEKTEERYRHVAEVALAAFGVKTPEAIERSVVAIQGLIEAFGPLDSVSAFEKLAGQIDQFQSRFGKFGSVTAEQARLIVGEIQKILDSIALLPPAERAALAEEEALLRAQGHAYAQIALQRKEYSEDILATEEKQLEREKEILKERQELLSQFASVFDQLQAKLRQSPEAGPNADVSALQAQIKALEDLPQRTLDQVNQLDALKTRLASAQQAQAAFAAGARDASLSVADVDDAIAGLVDSLKGVEGGFNNLPLASREAIENMLGRLQQAAQEGTATAATLNDAFLTVGQIIDQAGGSLGALGTALNRNAEDTLNLRREFGELEAGISDTADATGRLGDAQKDAATKAKEASDAAIKAAGEQAEAYKNLADAAGKANEQATTNLSNMERLLQVSLALKECWATTSIG